MKWYQILILGQNLDKFLFNSFKKGFKQKVFYSGKMKIFFDKIQHFESCIGFEANNQIFYVMRFVF